MNTKRLIDITVEELMEAIKIAVRKQISAQEPPRFIPAEEAKRLLSCGDTQLYYYRVNGKVAYVQDPDHPKQILYCRLSINEYLISNLKEAFDYENR